MRFYHHLLRTKRSEFTCVYMTGTGCRRISVGNDRPRKQHKHKHSYKNLRLLTVRICDVCLCGLFHLVYPKQYMMTSSNGNIFRVTGPLCGKFTGPGEFPTQRPVTRSFVVSFDLRLNERLSKQPWGWWFDTPSWSLWRQCNDASCFFMFSRDSFWLDYDRFIHTLGGGSTNGV